MEGLIDGIRILFCIQLLLVGGFLIFNKKDRNYPLALLCFLVGLYFLWRFIIPEFNNYFTGFFIFFSREIIVPPLIYLTLHQVNNTISFKKYYTHLSIPIFISTITALILIIFYKSIDTRTVANGIHMPTLIIISLVYLSKGRKLLKFLKTSIIYKAYIKYKVFFYVTITTYLLMGLVSFISYFIQYKFLLHYYGTPEGWHLTDTGNIFIDLIGHFFNGPYLYISKSLTFPLYIIPFFLLLFALSELSLFKSFFLPKDIMYDRNVIDGNSDIEKKLHDYFNKEKQFKNKELTISQCCVELGCSKKELNDYLKIHEKATFTGYLNYFRVEEFKLLIQKKENTIYDINSIAEMAGFKSRATFYRVFKEIEGITPTEFKNDK